MLPTRNTDPLAAPVMATETHSQTSWQKAKRILTSRKRFVVLIGLVAVLAVVSVLGFAEMTTSPTAQNQRELTAEPKKLKDPCEDASECPAEAPRCDGSPKKCLKKALALEAACVEESDCEGRNTGCPQQKCCLKYQATCVIENVDHCSACCDGKGGEAKTWTTNGGKPVEVTQCKS